MALTIINGEAVWRLLPMAECIEAMDPAMRAVSTRNIALPPRSFYSLTDNSGQFGVMPGLSQQLGSFGAKLISLHPGNPAAGLPAIQGFVTLFDHGTGAPLAIVDGAALTALRTAAASGLATRELARPEADSLGMFGTGVQAQSHIDAVAAVRNIRKVRVWGRDHGKAERFAAERAQATGMDVQAVVNPAEAAACDVICTVTAATEPVLRGGWVEPGAHVNLVGAHSIQAREADSELLARSSVYVDLMDAARRESGDIMIPLQRGELDESRLRGELGALLQGDIPGRLQRDEVTLYKSLGNFAQDLYAAQRLYEKARDSAPQVDW